MSQKTRQQGDHEALLGGAETLEKRFKQRKIPRKRSRKSWRGGRERLI